MTKPDKGNGVVILDRNFYNNTMEEIISDNSKFEKIHYNLETRSFTTTFYT